MVLYVTLIQVFSKKNVIVLYTCSIYPGLVHSIEHVYEGGTIGLDSRAMSGLLNLQIGTVR